MSMTVEMLERYPELRAQSEIVSALQLITHNKLQLRHIFEKNGVSSTGEMKAKITVGELPEHPAYEDYLEAMAYEIETGAQLDFLEVKIKELKG